MQVLERPTEETFAPGDGFTEHINQGDRDCTVLAVLDGKMLYEYTMPNGSSCLRMCNADGSGKSKPIAYRALSNRWLQAIVTADVGWEGKPQKNGAYMQWEYGKRVKKYRSLPSPAEMLKERQSKAE